MHRLTLGGLALLLASCSLINSYDDVVASGGGGSGASGGGGSGAAGGSGGMGIGGMGTGGMGTGGGGGMAPTLLSCEWTLEPQMVGDKSAETPPKNQWREGAGIKPNGNSVWLFANSGPDVEAVQIALPQGMANMAVFEPGARIRDARRVGTNGAGLLLVNDQAPGDISLLVFDGNLTNLSVFPIADATFFDYNGGPRNARFQWVGPENDRIDVLASGRSMALMNYTADHFSHSMTGNTAPVRLRQGGDRDVEPTALLTNGNANHAFVGEAFTAPSHQYYFLDGAMPPIAPTATGPAGTMVLDVVRDGNVARVAMAQIEMEQFTLRVGEVPMVDLSNFNVEDLPVSKVFATTAEIPTTSRPRWIDKNLFALFGARATSTKLSLQLFTGDGTLRLDAPDLLDAPMGKTFGEMTVVVPDDFFNSQGGQLSVAFTERDIMGGFDQLFFGRLTCTAN